MTLAPILRKRLNIHGSTLRSRPLDYQRQMTDAVEQHVLPALDSGEFQVKIDREFDWTSVAAAHKHMEDNKNQGKIILNIT
ncbi:hypothetical protein H4R34_005893 [Dimargaris verticillata]|uniref:Quinone oxidoreductase n=1 Tax=Dimargaris verticillata TaxID=2761393 RepID=A0A9W8AY62_9FUNG|nr:hypothetical protein H4R34_005893 [Dimargaris verticillata]